MPIEKAEPPAPAARKKPAPANSIIRSARTAAREEALNGIGQIASMFAVMRGNYADAGAVAQHGPGLSHEVALMGESNEQIASWLDYLTQTGPYMGLFKAGLPLLLQLAANHDKIDYTKLPPDSGVIDPSLLEKRVRAEMEMASARLLAEIREIEKQAAEARRTITGEAM